MARYIDADKLSSKVLDVWGKFEKQGKNCYVFADIFVPLIVSTPTEEVTSIVRGKWKKDADNLYHCSVCGKPELTVCAFGKIENHTPYCPWCSSKMRESEEEE